ncbi:hypothetical protein [Thalassococcus sp. S3]|uniref:hypothetical protein n=1 Tax=Thalassococcus sp. S3 TaxID=2017482 RepID=UPI00102BAD8E|nr:hypothetical protein [Thalassococcus sp. S3]
MKLPIFVLTGSLAVTLMSPPAFANDVRDAIRLFNDVFNAQPTRRVRICEDDDDDGGRCYYVRPGRTIYLDDDDDDHGRRWRRYDDDDDDGGRWDDDDD